MFFALREKTIPAESSPWVELIELEFDGKTVPVANTELAGAMHFWAQDNDINITDAVTKYEWINVSATDIRMRLLDLQCQVATVELFMSRSFGDKG